MFFPVRPTVVAIVARDDEESTQSPPQTSQPWYRVPLPRLVALRDGYLNMLHSPEMSPGVRAVIDLWCAEIIEELTRRIVVATEEGGAR